MESAILEECTQALYWWHGNFYDIIFVAVPKTGGTAISKVRLTRSPPGHWDPADPFLDRQIHGRTHRSIYDYVQVIEGLRNNGEFLEPNFLDFGSKFKFGFVRNPWCRAVSVYRNKIKSHRYDTFKEFVDNYHYASQYCIEDVEKKYKSQLDWFKHLKTGEILVDFIGRFENIDKDFMHCAKMIYKKLEKRVGTAQAPYLWNADWKLERDLSRCSGAPLESMSTYKEYRKYYTNTTRNIIRERFAEDIEYFGYEF